MQWKADVESVAVGNTLPQVVPQTWARFDVLDAVTWDTSASTALRAKKVKVPKEKVLPLGAKAVAKESP